MSRKPGRRLRWSTVVVLLLLLTAATAFGATMKLKLKGPSGTLRLNTKYKVTASGTASPKANTLFAYEGGQVRGGTAAIKCYATEKAEYAQYKPSARVHVYLGSKAVNGHFSMNWKFIAANPGPRSFCAYLASSNGSKTYAAASLHWTNQ